MEIKIDLEAVRKNKLFVATPMYGGQCYGLYMKSCLDLQNTMVQYGIETRFSFLFNESLITRARNYLVDEFLRSDCTHMLFLDSDIMFDAKDVVVMMALDKDIIGGSYCKKALNWNNIRAAITNNPDIPNHELENIVGEYVFNPVKGTSQFSVSDPLEVLEIGTGYMMIKREVFLKMIEAFQQLKYRPDHVGQENFDGSRYIHAFFDTIIDTEDSIVGGGTDRYLSEDYSFSQMWRKLGGSIWLCPWMKTKHVGSYAFTGNMPAVAHFSGRL
jgi:hypothetical protein